jgi:osmotically inducible protein OsmC
MKRTAEADWTGDTQTGQGSLTTMSGALNHAPYSFKTRIESVDGKAGTNPEELLAAAHAGCFTMGMSFILNKEGFPADSLHTEAVVEMGMGPAGTSIDGITLNLQAKVPGITPDKFQELANFMKGNCPVSKALSSVPIRLNAQLI